MEGFGRRVSCLLRFEEAEPAEPVQRHGWRFLRRVGAVDPLAWSLM